MENRTRGVASVAGLSFPLRSAAFFFIKVLLDGNRTVSLDCIKCFFLFLSFWFSSFQNVFVLHFNVDFAFTVH